MTKSRSVGIFAGTFDPVHNGHVAFVLAAIEQCHLDEVVFLPERQPRGKQHVTSLSHRMAMLQEAIAGNPKLSVLELPDDQFTVAATLPELELLMPDASLSLLVGTDVARSVATWPHAEQLLAKVAVIVAVRAGDEAPRMGRIVRVSHAHVAASHVRGGTSTDIAPAVRDYINKHHLYRV
jgi:nicotinate-nucleotide adenylyltransferase